MLQNSPARTNWRGDTVRAKNATIKQKTRWPVLEQPFEFAKWNYDFARVGKLPLILLSQSLNYAPAPAIWRTVNDVKTQRIFTCMALARFMCRDWLCMQLRISLILSRFIVADFILWRANSAGKCWKVAQNLWNWSNNCLNAILKHTK